MLSLVGELRSCKPHDVAKKKTKKQNQGQKCPEPTKACPVIISISI